MYQGKTVRAARIADGFVELCFDREASSINKLDQLAMRELGEAAQAIAAQTDVRGVLMTSAKEFFIVGADITEFIELFSKPEAEVIQMFSRANESMNAIEDLPCPTVAAINGFALGGGFEAALAADFRVAADTAQVGLPEVNLGLIPGFGGTVRLPRLTSPQTAIEWLSSGKPSASQAALAAKAIDEIAPAADLRKAALALLEKAANGALNWRERRAVKLAPVPGAAAASTQLQSAIDKLSARAKQQHQPAISAGAQLVSKSISESRAGALQLETAEFVRMAKTQAAASLIQIFLSEQQLKRQAKEISKRARPVKSAAVLGAGIMGGGICYASAARGIPVLMKDINQKQLDLGMSEAKKLLGKQVSAGRMKQEKADGVLAAITPQLGYENFDRPDVIIEAVVEKIEIKHAVLREVESKARPDAIIASNTSSLRIDDLAKPLARPENFIGMHFFNPAPIMPLVEVVRGTKTGETAIAAVVGYATAMGKTPIVVKDGPGFLVNRVLTPYMLAFLQLVGEGVDFAVIDQVMEQFGWPMGPAYLNDVIGMDTGTHVFDIISTGFPQRLQRSQTPDAVRLLAERGRLGQKTGMGFYKYESDPAGKPIKQRADDTYELIAAAQPSGKRELPANEIVERMMLAMIAESAWCLEDGVVGTPEELDMALLLGLGLPRYLGGALKYADWLGLQKVVELSDRYARLGGHYSVPESLRAKAAKGERYYS
ncbi:MAG TPA: fatty acid oxidation complex subunit alpha FadB [Steroidobacter sp.]|uniref:fatty acid oxidation complex subunit alpha FadB n=1 Tax=Steroidobacter sp. TaxID=1978227 RepID=UPI002ED83C0C